MRQSPVSHTYQINTHKSTASVIACRWDVTRRLASHAYEDHRGDSPGAAEPKEDIADHPEQSEIAGEDPTDEEDDRAFG